MSPVQSASPPPSILNRKANATDTAPLWKRIPLRGLRSAAWFAQIESRGEQTLADGLCCAVEAGRLYPGSANSHDRQLSQTEPARDSEALSLHIQLRLAKLMIPESRGPPSQPRPAKFATRNGAELCTTSNRASPTNAPAVAILAAPVNIFRTACHEGRLTR